MSQLLRYAASYQILRDIMNASRGCRCDLFKDCPISFLQSLAMGHKISQDSCCHICFPEMIPSANRCRPRNVANKHILNLMIRTCTNYLHPDIAKYNSDLNNISWFWVSLILSKSQKLLIRVLRERKRPFRQISLPFRLPHVRHFPSSFLNPLSID